MKSLLQSYKIQSITFLFLWLVSMILSAEFILSVSMIGLIVLALFQLDFDGPYVKVRIRESLSKNFENYKSYKAWLYVSIPFLLVLVSALYSTDVDYTLERLRIKLPFLVLPFAFLSMPKLERKECFAILYFLLVIMFAACLYVLMEYLSNFEYYNDLIGKGQPLPTPSNHIRFSLTLALTILGGIALWKEKFHFSSESERWFIGGITVFLFVFIHVLSVRSGILALYLGLFFIALQQAISQRKYGLFIGVSLLLIAIPFIAYKTIPSFREKINYARWDYMQYVQGIGKDYSDSERITSLQVGLKIGNANPILGIGAGDLKKEVKKIYAEELEGKYSHRMPHNQFVSVYAGTGIIGLFIFLIGFLFPLFYKKNYQNPLFLALHAIIFMSFMMENTIENNFGVSLYLFFLLIGLNYLSNKKV